MAPFPTGSARRQLRLARDPVRRAPDLDAAGPELEPRAQQYEQVRRTGLQEDELPLLGGHLDVSEAGQAGSLELLADAREDHGPQRGETVEIDPLAHLGGDQHAVGGDHQRAARGDGLDQRLQDRLHRELPSRATVTRSQRRNVSCPGRWRTAATTPVTSPTTTTPNGPLMVQRLNAARSKSRTWCATPRATLAATPGRPFSGGRSASPSVSSGAGTCWPSGAPPAWATSVPLRRTTATSSTSPRATSFFTA